MRSQKKNTIIVGKYLLNFNKLGTACFKIQQNQQFFENNTTLASF